MTMRRLIRTVCVLWVLFVAAVVRAQPQAPNFPLPERPDTLRILGVGNSFTDDGMMYLPDLLEAAGVKAACARLVPHIMNRSGADWCPLERRCFACRTPQECFREIETFLGQQAG